MVSAFALTASGYAQDQKAETEPQEVVVVWEHEEVYTPVTTSDLDVKPVDIPNLNGLERDACIMAQMAWGECRGMNTYERSLCMWCVLNRVDSDRFAGTVAEVIAAPGQFVGYKTGNPIDKGLYELAYDVLVRWHLEHDGVDGVGRTLPKEYLFFYGKDGHNKFRIGNSGEGFYDFTGSLPNPY